MIAQLVHFDLLVSATVLRRDGGALQGFCQFQNCVVFLHFHDGSRGSVLLEHFTRDDLRSSSPERERNKTSEKEIDSERDEESEK